MGNVEISQSSFTKPSLYFQLAWNHSSFFLIQVFHCCLHDAVDKFTSKRKLCFHQVTPEHLWWERTWQSYFFWRPQSHNIWWPHATFYTYMGKQLTFIFESAGSHALDELPKFLPGLAFLLLSFCRPKPETKNHFNFILFPLFRVFQLLIYSFKICPLRFTTYGVLDTSLNIKIY